MFHLGYKATPTKVFRLPAFPRLQEDNTRTGFLEDEQFRRVAAASSELWLRTFIEAAYTYGWRKRELLNLRVRQVDLKSRVIRLEPGTTKNRAGRHATMTGNLYALLTECVRGKAPDAHVFTRADGKPVRDFRKAWYKLCVEAGVGQMICRHCEIAATGKECETCKRRDLRYSGLILHDTRRTAARNLRRAGVSESVIMRIGGWKTASVFKRYDIVDQADIADAVTKLEAQRARAEKQEPTSEFGHDSGHDSNETGESEAETESERVN
jgi:integrase